MKEIAAVLILLAAILAVVVLATRRDPHPLLLDASLGGADTRRPT
jgi:hypothetical protein